MLHVFFSKTVVTIRTKISTAILHNLGTYMCNDINIIKLGFEKQPKLTKEQPIVNFFNFFKNCRNDLNENFLQPFYTLWGTYVCIEINIVRLGFKKQPKLTKEQPFVNFFNFVKTVDTIRTKFSTVIRSHIEVLLNF